MKNRDSKEFEVQLSEILVQHGVLAQEDIFAIHKAFHDSQIDLFDNFLLHEGLVDAEQLLSALSDYFEVPAFDVVGYFFETHYLHMFPKDMLLRDELIPLEVDENMMIMVTSNPDNPDLLIEIGECVSYDIRFYVGIGLDIIEAIEEFYDKADTEDDVDQDLQKEHHLMGELYITENEEPLYTTDEESEEEIFDETEQEE